MAYLAQIDIKRKGQRFRDNRTFDNKRKAQAWIEKRSKEIRGLVEAGKGNELRSKGRKLSDAISTYLDNHKRDLGGLLPVSWTAV